MLQHLKYGILLLFQFIWCTTVFPQSLDSLIAEYQQEQVDTNRLQLLIKIGKKLYGGQPDSAIHYFNLGLDICEKADYPKLKAELTHQKGVAIDIKGQEEALEYLARARDQFAVLKDTHGIARVELNFGVSYHHKSLYDQAMVHYLKAHDYFQQINEQPFLSRVLNNIAILYRKQNKYDRALEIYQQSLDIKNQIGDSVGVATTLMNIASAYDYLGEKDKMLNYFDQALQQYSILNNEEGVAHCHLSMGQALMNQGDLVVAESHLSEALQFYQNTKHTRSFGYILSGLSKIAIKKEDYQRVITLLEPELENIKARGRLEITQTFLENLGIAKGKTGSHEQAFLYMEEANVLKDSILQRERVSLTEEMQSRFDLSEKDKELLMANLELEKKTNQQRIYLAAALLVLFLLLGVAYVLYQKNKTNKLLEEKNNIINQSLKEKEALVLEIQKRTERNMEFISNLLHLQTEHLANASAITALKESENRVASMSLLHKSLSQQEHQLNIDIQSYLNQLIDNILQSYEIKADSLEVEKKLDNLQIEVDNAIPIGLIVNELLSNVFKHVVQNKNIEKVTITLKEQINHIFIEVTGQYQDSNSKKVSIRSFGLKLINLLVDQLQATWQVSEQDNTNISISIPK